MPQVMRQATVAIEDRRFYQHGGVDFTGLFRAAFKDVTTGKALQGGSTITQQLVRSLYIADPKRDLQRKIKEAKMADDLAHEHSKTWILWSYLNDVPYGTINGRTALGVEAASISYFGKHAKDLTLDQAALLAGLPQAPSQYNPFQNPSAALQRRNEVLQAMAKSGYITPEQATAATERPLGLHPGRQYLTRREPYFFDYVQEQMIERYGAATFRRGGLKIYTTVDPALQAEGRAAIRKNLYLASDPSSAIVSIDPQTGYIKAMASSGTYGDRTFNLAAQGHRQPGSAFKTFVLTTAVKEGVDPDTTTYVSKPLSLPIPGYGIWHVKTYGNTYGGAMNLVEATLKSDNTVYAQLDVDLGPKKIAQTAKDMGITTQLDGVPSEGLGGLRLGVSPLEMADAYATLASGGMHSDPQAILRVVFPDGKVDNIGRPKRQRVLPEWVAGEVTKILQENVQKGTATLRTTAARRRARPGRPTTSTTPGSTRSRPTSRPRSGSATRTRSSRCATSTASASPAERSPHRSGTTTWSVAHGTQCNSFPTPPPPQYSAFYGAHEANGLKHGSGYYGGGGGSTGGAAGGGGYQGYDPRLYASPPQKAPQTQSPSSPSGGGGKTNGNGKGGGTGPGGGQTPPAATPQGGTGGGNGNGQTATPH